MTFSDRFSRRAIFAAVFAAGTAVLLFLAFRSGPAVLKTNAEGTFIPPVKTAELDRLFSGRGYRISDYILNQKPIPRLFAEAVPSDFNRSRYDDIRPALFVEMMTPLILKANAAVEKERAELENLKKEFEIRGGLLPDGEEKVRKTAQKYGVTATDLPAAFSELSLRVDAIPPTLLLAMSAEATGWATSRYAREYNALFLEKDWDGNGIVPEEKQKPGPQYRIRTFPTVYDSILSYIHYLNTSGYFENFRIARQRYRRMNEKPNGYLTAGMLLNFPSKPFIYPDMLKHLIRQYRLSLLDLQELEKEPGQPE